MAGRAAADLPAYATGGSKGWHLPAKDSHGVVRDLQAENPEKTKSGEQQTSAQGVGMQGPEFTICHHSA